MMNQQFVNVLSTLTLFITLGLLPTSDSAKDALQPPANANCTCPNELLTFTCIINGGGTTLWTGTAFSCNSNEILLRHSQFSVEGGTSGSCNNGAITGRSIGVTNGCYSSELNVTVSPSLSGRTIRCDHDGSGLRTIGVSALNVVTAMDPPSSVQLMGIQNGQAQFRWTPIDSCSPVRYEVSTNCSTECRPMNTNLTTTSCTVSQLTTDVVVCDFGVQSVVCNSLMGSSRTAVVTLQAQASSVNVIPHYSAKNNSLSKFTIRGTNLTIALSDSSPIFIREYNVSYTDPTTGSVLHSTTVSTCGSNMCDTDVIPASSLLVRVCPPFASTVDITVTADTGFGQRLLSDPITIGCMNQYVDVQYNSTTSTITCKFLNQLDTSMKSCSIVYRECDQGQTRSIQGNSTLRIPNTVTLMVMFSDGSVCYNVTASSNNITLVLEGSVQSSSIVKHSSNVPIIAGVVAALVTIILVIIVVFMIIGIVYRRRKRKDTRDYHGMEEVSIIDKLNLELITDRRFKKQDLKMSCTLRHAVKNLLKAKFKQGHAYYEFTHEIENISEDKEIIFMKKGKEEYYIPVVNLSVLKECRLYGEAVRKPSFENYKIFVQSTGSGSRHLPSGSVLLYEHDQKEEWKPEDAPLIPLTSKHFVTSKVEKGITLEQFRRDKNLESSGSLNVFLEIGSVEKSKIGRIRDIILMDKENEKLLFTGPIARSSPGIHEKNWKVFILTNFDDKMALKAGSLIIHQNFECMKGKFYVLKVNEDNVQMSQFIENSLGVKYENGKAFFEFTDTEDLLYYKEVVRMHKSIADKYKKEEQGEDQSLSKQKGRKEELLETEVKFFYWIRAPGRGINPPGFDDYKVFVQSTSQGSRCLKSKTLLLYKINN